MRLLLQLQMGDVVGTWRNGILLPRTGTGSNSFATISQQERSGVEEGRLAYLWLIVMVLLFMLYGLYTWGIYPFRD